MQIVRLVFCCVWAAVPALSQAQQDAKWRGISPEMQQQVMQAASLTCDDGRQVLPLSVINDNYCDCKDGSDEPGTSACSHTSVTFHCLNKGFFPKQLATWRVNDGICDCCDGSDEYASGAECAATCQQKMNAFRVEKQAELEQLRQGASVRVQIQKNSSELFQHDQSRIAAMQQQVETLQKQVETAQAAKDEQERIEKKEQQDMSLGARQEIATQLGLNDLQRSHLELIIVDLATQLYSKEQVVKSIRLQREAAQLGDSPIEKDEAAFKVRDEARQQETDRIQKLIDERAKRKEEAEAAAAAAAEAAETQDVDQSTTTEATPTPSAQEPEEELKLPEKETNPLKLLFEKTRASEDHRREEANQARDALSTVQNELSNVERDLKSLQESLEKEYGDDKLLYSLKDTCAETKAGQYTYSICFFGNAKQDSTSLGTMEPIVFASSQGDEQHLTDGEPLSTAARLGPPREIKFTGGTKCWNGPTRSITVALECGATMELYGVEEPETCVYSAKLRTPIACQDSYEEMEVLATL